jgi:hypothetical protein
VLSNFISKVPGLAKLGVANVQSGNGALTGDIQMKIGPVKQDWSFLLYSGGGLQNTFIGFGPKNIFKFKDMFKKAPGIELPDNTAKKTIKIVMILN